MANSAGGVTRQEAVSTNKEFQKNLKETGAGSEGGKYPKGGGPNNPLGVNQYKGEGGGGGKGGGKKGGGGAKKAAAKKKVTSGSGAKKAAAKKVAAKKTTARKLTAAQAQAAKLKKLTPAQILALGRKQEAERRRKANIVAAAKKKADAQLAKETEQAALERGRNQFAQGQRQGQSTLTYTR